MERSKHFMGILRKAIVITEKELDISFEGFNSLKIIALRLLDPQDKGKGFCKELLSHVEKNNRGASALHVIVLPHERGLFDFFVRHRFRAVDSNSKGTVLFRA